MEYYYQSKHKGKKIDEVIEKVPGEIESLKETKADKTETVILDADGKIDFDTFAADGSIPIVKLEHGNEITSAIGEHDEAIATLQTLKANKDEVPILDENGKINFENYAANESIPVEKLEYGNEMVEAIEESGEAIQALKKTKADKDEVPILDKSGKVPDEKLHNPIKNLTDGTEPNSLQTPNSQAISEGAVALGENSIAGSKCFNITAFDDANKRYTLDSVEGLEVGDVFSLKLQNNYDNKGKITAINGNVVTVDNYYPDENADKYFRVSKKPTCGTTDFGLNGAAFGEDCVAAGENSFSTGKGNRSSGKYAFTIGKNCEAGYGSFAGGRDTNVFGENSFGFGFGVDVPGSLAQAIGRNAKALKQGASALGYHAEAQEAYSTALGDVIAASPYQTVCGHGNIVDKNGNYIFIVGNGVGSKRSDAFTVSMDGDGWFAKDVANGSGDRLSYKANAGDVNFALSKKANVEDMSKKADSKDLEKMANAVRNIATGGNVLSISDVSPLTHDVDVKIDMLNNLLSYPYPDTTKTVSGITYTDNGDGSVAVSGKATNGSAFTLKTGTKFDEGTFVISGCPSGGGFANSYNIHLTLYKNNNYVVAFNDVGNGSSAFNCEEYDYDKYVLMINVNNGATINNLIFRPKLSVSPTTTTLTVKDEKNKVQATYTPNADGSVSGVKSVYPVMKLELSDTTAEMTVEYNMNINAALSDKADIADVTDIADSVDRLNSKKADKSNSYSGFEGGGGAFAKAGGAIGEAAITGDGFAGGKQAQTMSDTAKPIDAIQLGTGWNKQAKTLQVYDYQLMDADGNIPAERLTNAPTFKGIINVTINNSASWSWDDISELKAIYSNGSYLVNISAVGDNADCHDTALLITKSETTNSELDAGKYTQTLITSDGAILYRESYWTMAGPQDWSKFKQIETSNIKDGAITTNNIINGAVTKLKLAMDVQNSLFSGRIVFDGMDIDNAAALKVDIEGIYKIASDASPESTHEGILIVDHFMDEGKYNHTLIFNQKIYIRTGTTKSDGTVEWTTFKTPNLENDSVVTDTIKDKAVTAPKLADDVQNRLFKGVITTETPIETIWVEGCEEINQIMDDGVYLIKTKDIDNKVKCGIFITDRKYYDDSVHQVLIIDNDMRWREVAMEYPDEIEEQWKNRFRYPYVTPFDKGAKNGVAPLDGNAKIPQEYLYGTTIPEYGVRWSGASSTSCERLGAAKGLVANAYKGSTDTAVVNDFDNIYPWSGMRRCNVNESGDILAYEDDPNFKLDGTNGDVMVEIPKFYYKRTKTGTAEEWWICGTKLPGYELHPLFMDDGKEMSKVFHSCYNASAYIDETANKTKLRSASGDEPKVRTTMATFRTYARNKGAIWGMEDLTCISALQMLYLVEYANTNSQAMLGQGCTTMSWSNNVTVATAAENTNSVTLATNPFLVGQRIEIGTSLGSANVSTTTRNVTAVSGKTVTFDGDPITVAVGNIVWNVAPLNGTSDTIGNKSGWVKGENNYPDGKADVRYRGIEGFHGKNYRFIDGCNIKDYQTYYCNSMTDYANSVYDGKYKAVGYTNANADGWAKSLGYDINAPWVMMTNAVGGSSNTYIPDYYYQNTGERLLLLGGHWSSGSVAGLFSAHCDSAVSVSYLYRGVHLLIKKP